MLHNRFMEKHYIEREEAERNAATYRVSLPYLSEVTTSQLGPGIGSPFYTIWTLGHDAHGYFWTVRKDDRPYPFYTAADKLRGLHLRSAR